MHEKTPARFFVILIGLVVTASALIMLIPRLFDSPSPLQSWAAVVLGVLAAGFGVGALVLRRDRPSSAQP